MIEQVLQMKTDTMQNQTKKAPVTGVAPLLHHNTQRNNTMHFFRLLPIIAQLVLTILLGGMPTASYAQLTDDNMRELLDRMNEYANAGKLDEARAVNELFLKEKELQSEELQNLLQKKYFY